MHKNLLPAAIVSALLVLVGYASAQALGPFAILPLCTALWWYVGFSSKKPT